MRFALNGEPATEAEVLAAAQSLSVAQRVTLAPILRQAANLLAALREAAMLSGAPVVLELRADPPGDLRFNLRGHFSAEGSEGSENEVAHG